MSDKSYKKDLESLFKTGGEVPERFQGLMENLKEDVEVDEAQVVALQTLHDAEDFRSFAKAVREYRKAGHAFPDDEDLLVRLLDLPDERTIQAALEQIIDLDRRRGFNRKAPVRNRIATIRSVAEDPRTETLLAKLAEIV